MPKLDDFLTQHKWFFEYLLEWLGSLETIHVSELTDGGREPHKLAILSEDLVKGFTSVGRLASPWIAGILPAVVELLELVHSVGVDDFVLPHDSHPPDSPEFDAYGPHCVTGTVEAETVDELASLPFADRFTIIPKQSLNPAIGTDLIRWFEERPRIESVIVVGDCTDLCVYQAAMYLRLWANYIKRPLQVIVPENCVQTYGIGLDQAEAAGATPHDADLMHIIFLYHMALNGIRVVSDVSP